MKKTPIQEAIDHLRAAPIARACGISPQAVGKWYAKGRLPRTEWTGETEHAKKIEALSKGKFPSDVLLGRTADTDKVAA